MSDSRIALWLRNRLYGSVLVPAKKDAGKSRRRERWYRFLLRLSARVRPLLRDSSKGGARTAPAVVFLHESYYHFNVLAAELARRGWRVWTASVQDPTSADLSFARPVDVQLHRADHVRGEIVADQFVEEVAMKCDVLYFSGMGMMRIANSEAELAHDHPRFPREFSALKQQGVRIGYSLVGCNDGVSQSTWYRWSDGMCDKCRFQREPGVCSDLRNLAWGAKLAMFCDLIGGELMPRLDYFTSPQVVSAPLVFCVDEHEWRPDIEVPEKYRLQREPGEILVLHAFGNFSQRVQGSADPKGTRRVIETVERLRAQGLNIRLVFADKVPSKDMKYLQAQADIIVDQLYFGRYGAMARESFMLGKPVVGYLKFDPAQEDAETAQCLAECPIVHASVETLGDVLAALAADPGRRAVIGTRSREFALKWHSSRAAADRFERLWRDRYGIGRDHG